MNPIAYLLDENVDPRLHQTLRRRWPHMTVLRMGAEETLPLRTPDPEILLWCEIRGVSLVTNNRRSMPVHLRDHLASRRHVPGIFVLPVGWTLGEIAERLALVWGASAAEEHIDRIVYLAQIT